ncbi:MAG: branched-chain amino acid ABC transporter permease, partial [Deltaproteobacteria bacterium]
MNADLPCGIFNTQYEKDIAIVRTKAHWAWLIVGVVLSVLIPPMLSAHWLSWCIETCIVIVAVLGLYFVTGLCGQISLGQAGFMAVGAYTTAMLMGHAGLSYWIACPLATVTAGLTAVMFGLPS